MRLADHGSFSSCESWSKAKIMAVVTSEKACLQGGGCDNGQTSHAVQNDTQTITCSNAQTDSQMEKEATQNSLFWEKVTFSARRQLIMTWQALL